jgi:hypothetical protein
MPAPCPPATATHASRRLIHAARRRIEECRTHMLRISEHNLQRTADTLATTNERVNESLVLLVAPALDGASPVTRGQAEQTVCLKVP